MDFNNLIELPTKKFLEKLGIGKHVPGSGSAAALQGMISAQLILTVISLTNEDDNKKNYIPVLPHLNKISSDIKERIYPILEDLFQQDSDQFHSVIQLRNERDRVGFMQGRALNQKAQDALKLATETLITVAGLCVDLADAASFLFDNAFKSARGDSGVALFGAIAPIAGCLSIINLNLLSIDDEEWIKNINLSVIKIKNELERLSKISKESSINLEKEALMFQSLQAEIRTLKSYKLKGANLSNREIEELAKKVQNMLWKYQDIIWKWKKPENHQEILNPQTAFEKLLKYKVIKKELAPYEFLGEYIDVAGVIDNGNKLVGISTKFSVQVQNFTLAHELGHAFLHTQQVLHRDRALDGSGLNMYRDPMELQADKFATYFLMPRKLVIDQFNAMFQMDRFIINDDNVFALTGGGLDSFRYKYRNLRDLSQFIASAKSFHGTSFKSIAEVFKVSIAAMAIRLEELGLIEYR